MQKMKKIKEKILSISLAACLLLSGCETTSADPEKNENTLTGNTGNSAQSTGSNEQSENDGSVSNESGQDAELVEEKTKNTLFREGLLAVKEGDMWGYINENGEYVIEPQFKNAFNFMPNGLAIAGDETSLGLIDKNGDYILEPTYGVIEKFDEYGIARVGFYRVNNQNKTQFDAGLINEKGECILEPKYQNIGAFNKLGWAFVENFGFYNYINTDGKFLIDEDMMITGARRYFDSEGWVRVEHQYFSGYYDSNGNQVIPIEYGDLGNFASNGLAYAYKTSDKYGYIDRNQNYVIPPKFDLAKDFDSSGFAAVNIGYKPNYDPMTDMKPLSMGKWGFIDEQGNYVIEPKYDELVAMKNGVAIVKLNEKYGYVNLNTNVVIEPVYDEAQFVGSGIAAVVLNNKIGAIDQYGQIVLEPNYTAVSEFTNGIAKFNRFDLVNDKIVGYVGWFNEEGKILVEAQSLYYFAEGINFDDNGHAWVTLTAEGAESIGKGSAGYSVIIDINGNIVVMPSVKTSYISSYSNNGLAYVRVEEDGQKSRYGYIDTEGNVVIEPIYDGATNFYDDGYAIVKQNDKKYIIKANGEKVFEIAFEDVQPELGSRIPTFYYY